MFFGLEQLHDQPSRNVRIEFTTHVDPFIEEGFRAIMAIGSLLKFSGWSRSYYTRAGHVESLQNFNKIIHHEPTTTEWTELKAESFAYFHNLPKVTSLPALTGFDQVKFHEGTSAGYGYALNPGAYPTHKGPPNGPNHKRAKKIASKIVHECIKHSNDTTFDKFIEDVPLNSTPDIAFTRTQLTELPNLKVRNVFGECFHYVLLEGLFAQPLIQAFMAMDTFYFIGENPVTAVPRLINSLIPRDQYFLSLDWSKFDASVQPYEIDLAFDLLESMIDFPDEATRLIFIYVRRLFMKRKLLSPDGKLFMRFSGVPSGSYFTHLIDSIINWNRVRYLFKLHRLTHGVLVTHGDDCLTEIFGFHDCLNELTDDANKLGWYIKREKSQLFKDRSRITFLGRSSKHGANFRDIDRCLRLMYYPEYPVTDPQISIARLKAIDADSGFHIPEIQNVYHYLSRKYGDEDKSLPREFRRYFDNYHSNPSI